MWPILFGIAVAVVYIIFAKKRAARLTQREQEHAEKMARMEAYTSYLDNETEFDKSLKQIDAMNGGDGGYMAEYKAYKESHPVPNDEYHVAELIQRRKDFAKYLEERSKQNLAETVNNLKEQMKNDPECESSCRESGLYDLLELDKD